MQIVDERTLESLGRALIIGGVACSAMLLIYFFSPGYVGWNEYAPGYYSGERIASGITNVHMVQFMVAVAAPVWGVLAARLAGNSQQKICGLSGDLISFLSVGLPHTVFAGLLLIIELHNPGVLLQLPRMGYEMLAFVLVGLIASFFQLRSCLGSISPRLGAFAAGIALLVNFMLCFDGFFVGYMCIVSESNDPTLLPSALMFGIAPFGAVLASLLMLKSQLTTGLRSILPAVISFGAGSVLLFAPIVDKQVLTACVPNILSKDEATSQAAISSARIFLTQDSLLRACYAHNEMTLLEMLLQPWLGSALDFKVDLEEARIAFYRIHGKPFNELPRPWLPEDFRDSERGRDAVAGKTPGVALSKSAMVNTVDGAHGVADLKWTMEFSNSSKEVREARMQLQLPPGAVVSNAWLWVNGAKRAAAVDQAELVRDAYESMVVQQYDPLLVSWVAKGKVMVQCFPIPANGTMKIELEMSAPLVLSSQTKGTLALPRIIESNYLVKAEHKVRTDFLMGAASAGGSNIILSDKQLSGSVPHSLSFPLQLLESKKANMDPVKNLQVVIDGSVGMGEHLKDVAEALRRIPANVNTRVRFASNDISSLVPSTDGTCSLEDAIRVLPVAMCAGGADNLPALAGACNTLHKRKDSAVLWIHAPQPIFAMRAVQAQALLWRIAKSDVPLIDFEVLPGPNVITSFTNHRSRQFHQILETARIGTVRDDLSTAIDQFVKGEPYLVATGTSTHSARAVKAYRDLMADILDGMGWYEDQINLAKNARLVTPITSAIVMPSFKDYERWKISKGGLRMTDNGQVVINGQLTLPQPVSGTLVPGGAGSATVQGVNTAGTVRTQYGSAGIMGIRDEFEHFRLLISIGLILATLYGGFASIRLARRGPAVGASLQAIVVGAGRH